MNVRALREPGTIAVRQILELAILIALLPGLMACQSQRDPSADGRTGEFQPISDQPVEFTFPHKGDYLPVEILVEADPAGSVAFDVYTDQQLRGLDPQDASIDPIGTGTAGSKEDGALIWRGSSSKPGIYHVLVHRVSSEPASFRITVSGSGAGGSLPSTPSPLPTRTPEGQSASPEGLPTASPTAQPAAIDMAPRATPEATQAAGPAKPATATPAPAPDASPGPDGTQRAFTGEGNFNVISKEPMEFDFHYPGRDKLVKVIVEARPPGSVGFSVYTDQQWTVFAAGNFTEAPIGRGTVNPHEPGTLFWQGNSPSDGLYHIQVFRLSEPAAFWIALSGPGATELISLSPPAVEP